jgi:hypothetical protein
MKSISLNLEASRPNLAMRPGSHCTSDLPGLATYIVALSLASRDPQPRGRPTGSAAIAIEPAWPGAAHEQPAQPTVRGHGMHLEQR